MKATAPLKTRGDRLTVGSFALAACLTALLATNVSSVPAAGPCPNEALREAQASKAMPQGTVPLPGCMALEMVSPAKKFSLPAFSPWFSLDGDRVDYRAVAALADTPGLQSFAGDNYVASRGGEGWQTASTSPPADAVIALGSTTRGGPIAFATDLGSWLSIGATRPQAQVGVGRVYRGALGGSFEPFSPLLVTNDDNPETLPLAMVQLSPRGVSADLSTVVAQVGSPSAFFLPGDPRNPSGNGEAGRNSYVISNREGGSSLELLARDKDGTVYGGRCGTRLGGGTDPGRMIGQGAVSADGLRIHFTTRPAQLFDPEHPEEAPDCSEEANPLRVMERVGLPSEAEIAPVAPALPAGNDRFQGASADGTKVYFTTAREVTGADQDTGEKCSAIPGSSAGCDLYLYDATKPEGSRLTLVSSGDGADVLSSITALSGDGSHAYFVAEGILTADTNPEGVGAVDGQPNLYLYDSDTGQTSFVGTLAAGDKGVMWGSEGSFIGSAYTVPFRGDAPGDAGDGHVLVFASDAPLTVGDDDGGHSDLFRYDADAETLVRVSAAPAGSEDDGPFDVTVNANSANARGANLEEIGRFASEDGETVAFDTAAALLPGDEDEAEDPYVWKAGELGFVNAEVGTDNIPVVSPGGEEVAFPSPTPLLPQDRDFVKDVYVLRVDGGFPLPPPPPALCDPLVEGACQGPLPPPPGAVANASSAIAGAGNVQQRAKPCRKGVVKKKGRCVKRKQRKGGKKNRKGGRSR